jgi:hypothetical protein
MKKEMTFAFLLFGILVLILIFPLIKSQEGSRDGSISLTVLPNNFEIFIHSPKNISYNFSKTDFPNFNMDLNVSSTIEAQSWWFNLEELPRVRGSDTSMVTLGGTLSQNFSFMPNTTFIAKRFWNNVTVYANNSVGMNANKNVVFFVHINNTAPSLNVPSQIYTCEGSSAEQRSLSQTIDATDPDENDLGFQIEPTGTFFVDRLWETIIPYHTFASGRIGSITLYNRVGFYQINISVGENDILEQDIGPALSDRKTVDITVVEMNSRPRITNPLGTQTKVWGQGDNSSFIYDFDATDDESGDESTGRLSFNISFDGPKLFNITPQGFVNFTANASQIGVYNVTVCVTDQALLPGHVHPLINSTCGQDGSNQSDCNRFQLTITNENRAPIIVTHFPENSNFSVPGNYLIYFNVTERDPDGTLPDTYWYVDDVLEEYDNMSSFDEFNYLFGCGVSGLHSVKVVATDGLLNDSFKWNVNVGFVACSVPPAGGGGGGGGGGSSRPPKCVSNWVCYDWDVCNNIEGGLKSGELTGEIYRTLSGECKTKGYLGEFCGFQNRECFDVLQCNNSRSSLPLTQACYYTVNPNCSDGIKNCHDGSCEFLVDCSGPCAPCPTCSDGIQNQGEFGVDCGGPCPKECPVEKPLIVIPQIPTIPIYYKLGLGILIFIVLAIAIRIYMTWKKSKESVL